jgi:hypothetical protein
MMIFICFTPLFDLVLFVCLFVCFWLSVLTLSAELKIAMATSCSICLEEKPLYYLLHCQHAFCRECLSEFFETAIVSADLPVHCPQIGYGLNYVFE